MELKTQIIEWILNKQRDYHLGLSYLKQLSPLDPLLRKPESEHSRKELFTKLGQALKTVDFSVIVIASPAKQSDYQAPAPRDQQPSAPAKATASEQSNTQTNDLPGLSHVAAKSLEITDLRKNIAWIHRKIVKATSNAERKKLMHDAEKLQSKINYNNKLISRLESGEIDSIPDAPEDKKEDIFEVPAERWELDNKLSRLRSTRSKRSAKLKQLKADDQQDSPEYQQVAADYERYDAAIRALDKVKKERAKE